MSAADAFKSAMLSVLGQAPDVIEPGRLHRFATSDRRGDDAGWCRLFGDMRGGVFGCHRQGISETWSAADRATMTLKQRLELARRVMAATAERAAEQQRQWADNARRIAMVRAQCVSLMPGDPVTLYLKRRGFGDVWPLPECLRLHRALAYWNDEGEKLGTFSAMVAPMVAPDGRTVALHRTYLTVDGQKADLPSPKKLTRAAGPLVGASIPLHRVARGTLGIAEGIETAMAAGCASGLPTVASYCAGNMATWRWPTGVQRIVIFADHDKAGRESAERLKARAVRAGLKVVVMTPTNEGSDWCDAWEAGV